VAEALHIGTEAVSRMERGITMPTVQRLAELAEVYGCGIDELLIASSTRTGDQAELISQILHTLPEADRAMIVEVVQKIAARLKDGFRSKEGYGFMDDMHCITAFAVDNSTSSPPRTPSPTSSTASHYIVLTIDRRKDIQA
jgi:transcriptional regulator with XRE-family HTH domain